ncbi:MAG: hypothetical protein LBH24_03480 [Clostridiales bacterium]|jgi:hypothetical protein|nr:hypothetical protein [Clostridiales bacterium]
MIQQNSKVKQRLSGAVMRDKVAKIEDMLKIIRSEQYRLLTNFMYLNRENLSVCIDITEDGRYILSIRAETDHLIDPGLTL